MKKNAILLTFIMALLASFAFAQNNPIVDTLVLEQDQQILASRILKLENGSEEDLAALISYYSRRPNRPYGKIDSLKNVAVQKFPSGKIAFDVLATKFIDLKDELAQDSLYFQAKRDFPKMDFNIIHLRIAYQSILSNNFERAGQYGNMLTDFSNIAFITSRWADRDSIGAAKYAGSYIKDENLNKLGYDYLTAAYGSVLFKLGQEEEALKYGALSLTANNSTNVPFINYYSHLLEERARYNDLITLLEEPYIRGILNPTLEDWLLNAYKKVNPNESVAGYRESLKAKAKQIFKAEMAKQMLPGKGAPDFSLKDINGNSVSLKDFKGKTIVIDFWATWCSPCIAAFPAMQIALNSYKANPDVKFLFVHTKERSTNAAEEATAFLKDNKYSFDLYMDTKNGQGRNTVADAFGVTGIPAKYVIDRNGKIRFNIVGHMFKKDEVLAEEMKAAIELASGSE